MNCPHCASATTKEQTRKTTLGYCLFRCSVCKRLFNERTGTPFNFLEYPTDVVLLVVLWRLRYKLSLRDLAEMFLEQVRHLRVQREYFVEGSVLFYDKRTRVVRQEKRICCTHLLVAWQTGRNMSGFRFPAFCQEENRTATGLVNYC